MKHLAFIRFLCLLLCLSLLAGCSESENISGSGPGVGSGPGAGVGSGPESGAGSELESGAAPAAVRDNTPVVLVPEASGEVTYGNGLVTLDASHTEEGYVMVRYEGEAERVKLRIELPDGTLYTYDLHPENAYEVFPLTGGDGEYRVAAYEYRPATDDYISAFSQSLSVVLKDEFTTYLYPNQYVNFSADSETVAKGADLARGAADDLEVVTRIYQYITENISYDAELAANVQSGYLPDVDEVLAKGSGICFDYAALMAAMLRSQRIPTRLEIGYAGTAYHAWVTTHIDGMGWVNGIIHFDGSAWTLMDPTFAANSAEDELRDFIGNGDNYQTKYRY